VALRDAKSKAQSHRDKMKSKFNTSDSEYQTKLRAQEKLESSISSTISAINKAVTPPRFVVNPLPEREEDMLVVLFFAMMPQELDLLCSCLLSAQTMLVEPSDGNSNWRGLSVEESAEFQEVCKRSSMPATSFVDHYKAYSIYGDDAENQTLRLLPMCNIVVPENHGKQSVDEMSIEAHSALWFPSTSPWKLMYSTCLDPFKWNMLLTRGDSTPSLCRGTVSLL